MMNIKEEIDSDIIDITSFLDHLMELQILLKRIYQNDDIIYKENIRWIVSLGII